MGQADVDEGDQEAEDGGARPAVLEQEPFGGVEECHQRRDEQRARKMHDLLFLRNVAHTTATSVQCKIRHVASTATTTNTPDRLPKMYEQVDIQMHQYRMFSSNKTSKQSRHDVKNT